MSPAGPPGTPSVTPYSSDRARVLSPGGWLDGKVAAGLPGEVFHGDDRNLVREGTPTSGDCSARFGEPRGASHCEFRFVSRLWGLCRPPLQSSSHLLQGLMRRPPRPTRRRRPLCSSEDPGGGRESGEEGSPAAFPSWVIPSPNLLGRAGDHRPRIGRV